MTYNSNKPVHNIRYGSVVGTVWLDNTQAGYFYHTTFSRVFKSDEGWSNSDSFDDRDLPNLAKAAADVHTWIHQQKALAVTVKGRKVIDAERPPGN